jgi:3-methylcrotonyl-CoA carboxylase alpha subunit
MDEATREQLCAAAVKAARAVDYVGAGTIEFIADASEGLRADRIWFMEMNTRLQVEHPVTEEITGVDLVEWQLRVASGEALPLRQDELSINGWAMEARLYAEDPAKGFLPSTGPLSAFRLPDGYLRIETGVEEGGEVSPFYDPMIAKLVSRGETREDAVDFLWHGLKGVVCWPVRTNAAILMRLLKIDDFGLGNVTTAFIPNNLDAILPEKDEPSNSAIQDAATYFALGGGSDCPPILHKNRVERAEAFRTSPWHAAQGFRINQLATLNVRVQAVGRMFDFEPSQRLTHGVFAKPLGNGIVLTADGRSDHFTLPRYEGSHSTATDGAILSPMPGKIIAVEVAAGDTVIKGQKLLTLEAMKMEHTLTAPFDGVVEELNATPGAQVQVEAVLAKIVAVDASAEAAAALNPIASPN